MAEQPSPSFDVFLSHNSKDKPTVIALAERLVAANVKVWLDVWELRPGQPWQEVLEDIIAHTRSAAVLVGKDGLGPWENREMRALLNQFVRRGLPVIPVLLSDCPQQPELPLLLQEFTWVDCRGGKEEEGYHRLVWGITGVRPQSIPAASAGQANEIKQLEAQQPKQPAKPKIEASEIAGEREPTKPSSKRMLPLLVAAGLMTAAAIGYHYVTRSEIHSEPNPPTPTPPPSSTITPTLESSAEASLWAKIKNSTNPSDFSEYLQQYPTGRHEESAHILLDRLNAARPEPVNPVTSTIAACTDCPVMLPIPGGAFSMGSDDSDKDASSDEKPKHEVKVASFKLGKNEVTKGQYAAFVKDTGYASGTGCDWNNPGFEQDDNHPVVCVSLTDALAYIAWLNGKTHQNFRLPTEAEWEYACRSGGKDQRYCGGDNVDDLAWYYGNSGSKTQPVGGKDANGLGLFDMSGNAWEWNCSKYEEKYSGGELKCLSNNDAKYARAVRGGSWVNDPQSVRSAARYWVDPAYRNGIIGFRLAQD